MARFRKKKDINLGNVSIGTGDVPSKVDENASSIKKRQKEIEEDTAKKIEEYRKENPEEPKTKKSSSIKAPLKMKRSIGSLDGEYVDIAKRYLGLPSGSKPTIVELSKGIIKLFEDNAKLYKELTMLRESLKDGVRASTRHSWEQNSSWN